MIRLVFLAIGAFLCVVNTSNSFGLLTQSETIDSVPGIKQFVGIERAFPNLRFHRPVFLTGAGDGSNRIFVIEQAGTVRSFVPDQATNNTSTPKLFFDIRDRVSRVGNEEGFIGFAFHPNFKSNGEFFAHYSSSTEDMTGIVARYKIDPNDPTVGDPASEQIILKVKQPFRNHNGGTIAFGKDGYLYISLGDGGKANDPYGHGQNIKTLLGSILRIDVDATSQEKAYSIPEDNPFVNRPNAAPEIFALGLRNVWRFSFDRKTGELWAGDVGQDLFDEVSLIKKGGNYGWNRFEGNHDFDTKTELAVQPHDPPVAEYGREWGISITGGNVYRGKRFPELNGSYFYGDYVSGNLWRIKKKSDGSYQNELVRRTGRSIASFGEDDLGEVYLLSFDGGIYRIVPTAQAENRFAKWPRKISETGLFASIKSKKMNDQAVQYHVNAPFWSDTAQKSRYLMVPKGKKIQYRESGSWNVPVGTTIVKNFHKSKNRLLETRLIKRTENGWESATYVWEQRRNNEATLHPEGNQFEVWQPNRPERKWDVFSWHAPSSSECSSCHVDAAGYVLGLNTAQLNRDIDGSNQIMQLMQKELLELPESFDPTTAAKYVSPHEPSAPINDRARVYLEVNCAMCHRPGGPGNANIDLRIETELSKTGMLNKPPAQGDLGVADAMLICPSQPEKSVLWQRVNTLGAGRMPNIGSNRVDEKGSNLIKEWIEAMKAGR